MKRRTACSYSLLQLVASLAASNRHALKHLSAVCLVLLMACGGRPTTDDPLGGGGTNGNGGQSGDGDGDNGNAGDTGGNDPDPGLLPTTPYDGGEDPEPVCGNGEVEPGEICDDGNTAGDDGCSADCAEQDPDYDCSVPGQACINTVVCGNGLLEGNEVCDDGNSAAGDGCAAACEAIEAGWACIRPNTPCIALPVCGNGVRERGEACDDGQTAPTDGDGCTIACQVETGFVCRVPGQACTLIVCGDGVRTPGEECDDGEMPPQNGDGCSATCTLEDGFRCGTSGCQPMCGDGLKVGTEQCDDNNRTSGDGCSAACAEEPFHTCTENGSGLSSCVSTIQCGNSVIEPGEICDPPGMNGCNAGCASFSPDMGPPSTCGNSMIEVGETCDPPDVGDGCNAGCAVEAGFSCPFPNTCIELPRCGDGILHPTLDEECDDGNAATNDGCNACEITGGWSCSGFAPSVCQQIVCGNGVRTPNEQCDDGNAVTTDGCANCVVQTGWVCPFQNAPCFPRCGDGLLRGSEECDDGDTASGDGCNAGCRIELGYACPTPNAACVESDCGNGILEPGEGCDDDNNVAGDGCGPTCQLEPTVTLGSSPTVQVYCGDGMITGTEDCDDGNTDDDDGCTSDCELDDRFTCVDELDLPGTIEMQVTYRDFKAGAPSTGGVYTAGAHPDFQYGWRNHVAGIAGAVCTSSNGGSCGRLSDTAPIGKPVLAAGNVRNNTAILNSNSFSLWYQSSNPNNITGSNGVIQVQPFTRTLTLTQAAMGSQTYQFSSLAFYPIAGEPMAFGSIQSEIGTCNTNGAGVPTISSPPTNACDPNCGGTDCRNRNYHFTTELRYFFQYQGGETLTFYGDDDVWVFINGRLAVDLGGLHEQRVGRVLLGDDGEWNDVVTGGQDSNCSVNGVNDIGVHNGGAPDPIPALGGCYTTDEMNDASDNRFSLTEGNVYEIVLFHAERQSAASNFQLTLSGFLAPRTSCEPICGDGEVVGGEVCDDGPGNANGVSGACNTTCTGFSYCGDNVVQSGETCDNGTNLDLYVTGSLTGKCAPGCVTPAYCGDGTAQGSEQCDNGGSNNNSAYGPGSCKVNCTFGGYCGDGIENGGEDCDLGANNGGYGPGSCTFTCEDGPYCGDNVRNGTEQCDDSGNVNCVNCTVAPYCGDGITSAGEDCDFAQFNQNGVYGGCSTTCMDGPFCGDGTPDEPFEECDDGTALNTGDYNGCDMNCVFGPFCGDGALQAGEGEECDNGFNDDTYAFTQDACGMMCMDVPFCGDGALQSVFELCDEGSDNSDTLYNGCATDCDWGPYCGDGVITSPEETCDDGLDNRAYSADGEGCGYDCQPAPYCGDGERNGPEQCDLGDDNTGAYGGCEENCILAPYCGDEVVQGNSGEECDDGPVGSLACTPTCKRRGIR